MKTRTTFLTVPYGAYYHREVPEEDVELTHVGPGTPGGEYFRRFWHPVAFSHELGDLPVRLRILGEDLVLFRNQSGRVGVLELHCPHRGTSLEFGLVSERGIRCCYHGWLFDVDGRILETPGEPPDSSLKDRLCHGAYPVCEYGGLVFVYMGPPDKRPELPRYDSFDIPGYETVPGLKYLMPCNWLQIKENSMDPVHTAFLHTRVAGTQFTEAYGVLPELEWHESPVGLYYIATRRMGEHLWTRICDFIPPNVHQFGPNWEDAKTEKDFGPPTATHWTVPIDDTNTLNIDVRHLSTAIALEDEKRAKAAFGQMADRPYEERQRLPGDYDAQVGQRPIAIHALEHLVTTDRGVIAVRKLVREGIEAVKRGHDPKGVLHTPETVTRTYARDTVKRVPRLAEAEAERAKQREFGRQVAADVYGRPR
jgi:phenylpropionate dioxygenase-like ring-hydroxylating dioxygenase large terminal subunit